MKINCEVKVKYNYKKINDIIKNLPQFATECVEDVLKNIQGYAIRLEKGHKEEGIIVEMVDTSTMKTKGRVYADPSKFMTENGQSYLWFEYFGTRRICRTRTYWKNQTLYRNSVILNGIYQ